MREDQETTLRMGVVSWSVWTESGQCFSLHRESAASARISGRLPKTGKEGLSRFGANQALLVCLKTWITGEQFQALGHALFWPDGKVCPEEYVRGTRKPL